MSRRPAINKTVARLMFACTEDFMALEHQARQWTDPKQKAALKELTAAYDRFLGCIHDLDKTGV